MAVASPTEIARAQTPPADGPPSGPPKFTRFWPRGRTLTTDEAVELVSKVKGIPPNDRARAIAELWSLAATGWLVAGPRDLAWGEPPSWTRPETDPPLPGTRPQVIPQQKFYREAFFRPVFKTVQAVTGALVKVQSGSEEVPGQWFYTDGTPVPEKDRPAEAPHF